jgi:predicted nucleic acid-binding Zn ribbon protein
MEGDCPFKNWSSTVQEYASSSSSTEETSNRIEKVTIKEEKIVFETPTAFYRNDKRKEEDVSSNSNEKAVKRLRHWDLQNASYVANESKE